jgi:hypothetical protein
MVNLSGQLNRTERGFGRGSATFATARKGDLDLVDRGTPDTPISISGTPSAITGGKIDIGNEHFSN